ncbi:MAG: hypothetical protein JXB05_37230 [Myxococcaceae bacterium]|nr:hypothetical protein [Myxococcaceae bacterium]
MAENTQTPPPEKDKAPRSYATEDPLRNAEYAPLPPDITLRPERIELKHNVFVVSVTTMVFISLILAWLPLFNALLAGAFGGYHAGRMKRSLAAAAVTSVMVPAILGFAHFISETPSLYFLWGLTVWQWVLLHTVGMFIGAVSGAASRPLITERNLARRV